MAGRGPIPITDNRTGELPDPGLPTNERSLGGSITPTDNNSGGINNTEIEATRKDSIIRIGDTINTGDVGVVSNYGRKESIASKTSIIRGDYRLLKYCR